MAVEMSGHRISNDYQSLISDVCRIFSETTKKPADIERESNIIERYAKKYGWGRYEFRLLIEHQIAHDSFLRQPGHMNLRSLLNPAGEGRLLDVLADLKYREQIDKASKTAKENVEKSRLIPCRWSFFLQKQRPGHKGHRIPPNQNHCHYCILEKYQPEIIFSPYEAEKIFAGKDDEMTSMARWFQRLADENFEDYGIRTDFARKEILGKHGLIKC